MKNGRGFNNNMNMGKLFLGIDIGSTTVKTAILDDELNIIKKTYIRSNGESIKIAYNVLIETFKEFPASNFYSMGVTGSGSKTLGDLLNIPNINELVAQAESVKYFYPDARTIIEMGGQDSKFIMLNKNEETGDLFLEDFGLNDLCAAGTGSFLDQQAERLHIDIEKDFGRLAALSENPSKIAGRCTVFAKSDMIHLQQVSTPIQDIVAGLCYAVARNFIGVVAKGKAFKKPVIFQGGVSYNNGMIKAFEDVLGLKRGELIIPEHHTVMSAIGIALISRNKVAKGKKFQFAGLGPLEKFINEDRATGRYHNNLKASSNYSKSEFNMDNTLIKYSGQTVPVYIGVDVGSVSTNIVLLDENKNLIIKKYKKTNGEPIKVVMQTLYEILNDLKHYNIEADVKGVCTTGSGRYLIGDYIGADIVKNEITAQAEAAAFINSSVDTVFEIGGQDSKYIRIKNGVVVDFEMNKACAAGTGSFLEEQADKLNVDIIKDFADSAFRADHPCGLGERCTVFMESDLVSHQQKGATKDQLIAGLSYSIVENYLNKVVLDKPIGDHILFQGGVALNSAVVSAFEAILNKKIIVPEHNEVTGAIGSALLAFQNNLNNSKFIGFDLRHRKYKQESFECKKCPNLCEVNKVTVEDDNPHYYNARCDIFEIDKNKIKKGENLFKYRKELLFEGYDKQKNEDDFSRPRIGIPLCLETYDLFPFYHELFKELGFAVILSDETNKSIIDTSNTISVTDTCFPVKVVLGHVKNLLNKKIDAIFLPALINREKNHDFQANTSQCPYIQGMPFSVKSLINLDSIPSMTGQKGCFITAVTPEIRLYGSDKDKYITINSLNRYLKKFHVSKKMIIEAFNKAMERQRKFFDQLKLKGKEVLKEYDNITVLVGRPYNTQDEGINLSMSNKITSLGLTVMPMDFLSYDEVSIYNEHDNMFWHAGHKILSSAKIIKDNPKLNAVYITNYACGPDSFIKTFFADYMKNTPYLEIEIDEHNADAGYVTRLEAFYDSLSKNKFNKNNMNCIMSQSF
jgi:predicted CoA-substrate-specific enzyme activase